MIEGPNFSLLNKSKARIPERFRDLPFSKIVKEILGPEALVSIVFTTSAEIKKLNKKYRNKNESTDILSFILDQGGEIFISLADARLKVTSYKLQVDSYLPYLLIHGLIHLKGLDHSSKMERQEKFFCKKFSIDFPFSTNVKQSNSRNRRGHLRSAGSSSPARRRKPAKER